MPSSGGGYSFCVRFTCEANAAFSAGNANCSGASGGASASNGVKRCLHKTAAARALKPTIITRHLALCCALSHASKLRATEEP
eukprot:CAMPEP_0179083042 /NCGR_PEP_ID=MMETSP0796-20121207/37476_1 /TAXON_ID=73915 /ORGANISM="Pyrodinium bahamense, Strain pbaha01" /LENGTH=82 /DNA_ID=CAMNT_0020780441 /DNA_START=52 /DNA_END=300 /DNA_ORIENTATION=-